MRANMSDTNGNWAIGVGHIRHVQSKQVRERKKKREIKGKTREKISDRRGHVCEKIILFLQTFQVD